MVGKIYIQREPMISWNLKLWDLKQTVWTFSDDQFTFQKCINSYPASVGQHIFFQGSCKIQFVKLWTGCKKKKQRCSGNSRREGLNVSKQGGEEIPGSVWDWLRSSLLTGNLQGLIELGGGAGKKTSLNLYLLAAQGFHYSVCKRSINIITFSNDWCIRTFQEMFNYLLFLSHMAWVSSNGGLDWRIKTSPSPRAASRSLWWAAARPADT